MPDSRGLLQALIDDGRPLISLTGICLGLSGAFAMLQSATGHFLPHDIAFLRMSAEDLCGINECRIVHFMFHDRVSFGGALIAIAVLYLWLAAFPLKEGQRWAWWTLLVSGVTGFGSFLSYLGYGYLDSWHAFATIGLLPCFVGGLYLTNSSARGSLPLAKQTHVESAAISQPWFFPRGLGDWNSRAGLGRALLLMAATGMIGAGITILSIGMTEVFVSTDLAYMGLTRAELNEINSRLIPLIAHDRAGFGGAVVTTGVLLFACVWNDMISRSLWQGLLISGLVGWGSSIGIHPIIGYTAPIHLAPAVLGAFLFFTGLVLTHSSASKGTADEHD